MKIGILGTGIGLRHGTALGKHPGTEIKSIFGREKEKTERAAAELHAEPVFDIGKIINDPEIDLVLVCLPTQLHEKYTVEALKAGKHVFCEIPAAYDSQSVRNMTEAARQNGKVFMAGLFNNFSAQSRLLISQSEKWGGLRTLHLYRRTPSIWGDIPRLTFDLMIHDFDHVFSLKGLPLSLKAGGVRNSKGLWSYVSVLMEYEDALVTLEGNALMPASYPFTVGYNAVMESGSMDFTGSFSENGIDFRCMIYPEEGTGKETSVTGPDPYEAELEYALMCLKEGTEPELISGDRALPGIIMAEAAEKSLMNGGVSVYF